MRRGETLTHTASKYVGSDSRFERLALVWDFGKTKQVAPDLAGVLPVCSSFEFPVSSFDFRA